MQLKSKIQVVVAEDEAVLRQGIVQKIQNYDRDFTVVAEASNGQEALDAISRLAPELLITDVKMPVMDGLELIRTVQRRYPKVKIIILSGYSDFSYLQQAIRCGVSSYLLKPLEENALEDILRDLKSAIASEQYRHKQTVVYSLDYSQHSAQPLVHALFSVLLGNLNYDSGDLYLQRLCQERPQPHWDSLLERLIPDMVDWSVAEEESNRMAVSIRLPEGARADFQQAAAALQRRLQDFYPALPITIATSQYPVKTDDLWMCTQRLHHLMQQRCIPAKSAVFLLERDELLHLPEAPAIVKLRIGDSLGQLIDERDTAAIRQELSLVFRYMVDHQVSQRDFQKVILHIIRTCEFSGVHASATCAQRILRTLSTCFDQEVLAECLVDSMLEHLFPEEYAPGLGTQLVSYVEQHFVHLDQLEEITQVFHYSYAYLSRLFKKQTGKSINKFVLEKRLDLAKALIENNDNMNMTQVAELSGFSDRRNFLRSFKAYTGLSPTEYKSNIIPKG